MPANIESPVTSFDTIIFSPMPDIKAMDLDKSGTVINDIAGESEKKSFPWWILLAAAAAYEALS